MGFWGDILPLASFAASALVMTYVMYKGFQAVSKTINQNLDNIDTNKGIADSSRKGFDKIYNYTNDEKFAKFDAFRLDLQKSAEERANNLAIRNRDAILQQTEPLFHSHDESMLISSTTDSPQQNKNFRSYSEERLREMAQKDASKGDYRILYSQSEDNKELYNDFYREFRKQQIRSMAQMDALAQHKYKTGARKVSPVLQGKKLTVPAEVSIYQNLFVKEMSNLEEEHRKLMVQKQTLLKGLYEEKEFPAPMDPEVFYKTF